MQQGVETMDCQWAKRILLFQHAAVAALSSIVEIAFAILRVAGMLKERSTGRGGSGKKAHPPGTRRVSSSQVDRQ